MFAPNIPMLSPLDSIKSPFRCNFSVCALHVRFIKIWRDHPTPVSIPHFPLLTKMKFLYYIFIPFHIFFFKFVLPTALKSKHHEKGRERDIYSSVKIYPCRYVHAIYFSFLTHLFSCFHFHSSL